MKKIMKSVSFGGGLNVLTSDAKILEWCMQKAGHTVEEQAPEKDSWRVVVGGRDVFAVTDSKEDAETVTKALRGAGIQTSVRIEPNE